MPPLSTGVDHFRVIDVYVEVFLETLAGTPGTVAAITENTALGALFPIIFLATI